MPRRFALSAGQLAERRAKAATINVRQLGRPASRLHANEEQSAERANNRREQSNLCRQICLTLLLLQPIPICFCRCKSTRSPPTGLSSPSSCSSAEQRESQFARRRQTNSQGQIKLSRENVCRNIRRDSFACVFRFRSAIELHTNCRVNLKRNLASTFAAATQSARKRDNTPLIDWHKLNGALQLEKPLPLPLSAIAKLEKKMKSWPT